MCYETRNYLVWFVKLLNYVNKVKINIGCVLRHCD
ncbi:MAG: hypothetical protein XD77_0690 [Marinimicrobia bacterium 46_47]|nr:MAG: hypothetical protein XD77_0690 [Marinimicrobia bacterium 46_47]